MALSASSSSWAPASCARPAGQRKDQREALDLVVVTTHAGSDGPTVLEGLEVKDLVLLASCCKELRNVLLNEQQRLWHRALQVALPRVQFTPEFFSELTQGNVVTLLPSFLKAHILASKLDCWGDSPVLRLGNWRNAQMLSNRLKTFHNLAAQHLDSEGSYAKVFLAQLTACVDSRSMMHQGFVAIQIPAAHALQRPKPARKRRGKNAKIEDRPLHLHFVLTKRNQLKMAVCSGKSLPPRISWDPTRPMPQDQQRQRVVVDVSLADLSHQLLHFRGILLQVNGPWVDCPGLAGGKNSPKDMFAPEGSDVSVGPLCIIYMRDETTSGASRSSSSAGPSSAQLPMSVLPTAATKLSDALHLDCSWDSSMFHQLTNVRFPWLAAQQ
eukprot:TRINITY_DN33682_c0_g1_i1.p1 TRINITY_DN33682_c0_g1~~TRINITY_DN33682_c0_g1_i1.p1  ORF type:complete len:383 (-),score=55.38 TRINITY_DN33682_c0_g1_i1:98-1246(-)